MGFLPCAFFHAPRVIIATLARELQRNNSAARSRKLPVVQGQFFVPEQLAASKGTARSLRAGAIVYAVVAATKATVWQALRQSQAWRK